MLKFASRYPGLFGSLVLMMFLEYAIWGAWMPILGGTMANRHMAPTTIGNTYAMLWLGCIVTPFLGGQLADRRMASQVLLAVCHLIAAVAAMVMAYQTTGGGLILWMLIWSLLFAPTLGITNSLAFHHIHQRCEDEASREQVFSVVRTAGTIGWIVSAFVLFFYTKWSGADVTGATGPIREMLLTGILGIVMGLFCFSLPNTPPNREQREDPLAWRKALGLFRAVPGFGVFMFISFFAATEFQFFYVLNPQFLQDLHIPHLYVPITKSISQVSEVFALALLLPLFLPSRGMKWCLLVGSFAWPLRYFIFAMMKPVWLIVLSLGLHGFGYAFVMVVQQLYVDRVSPQDIRGSAQNLLTFITLGLGNLIGSLICGPVQQSFTHGGVTNWPPVFILPGVTTLLCAVAYMATFRNPRTEPDAIPAPA